MLNTATKNLWERYHTSIGHLPVYQTSFEVRILLVCLGDDMRHWITECLQCVQRKPGPEVRAPFVPITTSYPLKILAIEYLSLGKRSDTYPYLFVMTSIIQIWVAVPKKYQIAETTVKALQSTIVQH